MKLEVKVNVINEMAKMRTTAYGDRLAWLEELVQNAQRAKAKNVSVELKNDVIVFEDDGIGCINPNVLFEKSETGWDEATTTENNPFGEGFFSVMMVSNLIEVESIGFKAVFDVEEMFRTRNVECIEVTKSSRRKGFRVTLTKLTDEYQQYSAIERVKQIGQYIPNLKIKISSDWSTEVVETKDFTTPDGSPFAMTLKTDLFTGWVRPFAWGKDGYNDSLLLFAQSRMVKELYFSGITGVVHANTGAIDLRSPDRKEVISNGAWTQFHTKLNNLIKQMVIKVVKDGSDGDIDKYEAVIDRHLSVEEYGQYIRFIRATDADMAKIMKKIKELMAEGATEIPSLDELAKIIAEEERDIVESGGQVAELNLSQGGKIAVGSNSPQEGSPTGEKTGGKVSEDEVGISFYVEMSELIAYKDKLGLAEHYGMVVILCRNKLEKKTLEDIGVLHLSKLNETVELKAKLHKVGAEDAIEERAMFIFKVLSRLIGSKKNLFKIGDMDVTKEVTVGARKTTEKVEAMAVAREGEIFVDRGQLKKEQLEIGREGRLKNSDRAFIAKNLDTITHELCHVLYNVTDNTTEFYKGQAELAMRIVSGMY